MAEERLKLAVFIDFDNIQIGVKDKLGKEFDVELVLEALKERGEVVTKIAYGDWHRSGEQSRSMTQHAVQMVQRSVTPRGDKNGADINLALDVASKIKAGSVWVNSTNLFDAASGFGGYRESGYGREGGREGLFEYLRPAWQGRPRPSFTPPENGGEKSNWGAYVPARPTLHNVHHADGKEGVHIDRTPKMYIGGKQVRPDGHYTRPVLGPKGELVGQVGDGNRKDIRDAVEAAHAAHTAKPGWAMRHAYNRSQILYFIGENLSARADEFARRMAAMTGAALKAARAEVEASVERLFTYAAWADKYGGSIQETTLRGITVAVNEPVGVLGIACPDEPALLAFVSLMAPAIARGNTVVMIPSQKYPLSATDFYQGLDTSDVPPGVVNIVTGEREHLVKTLVQHEDVDGVWYFGTAEGSYHVEYESAANMKRTWVNYGMRREWASPGEGAGHEFLHEASQGKNIWGPTGGGGAPIRGDDCGCTRYAKAAACRFMLHWPAYGINSAGNGRPCPNHRRA